MSRKNFKQRWFFLGLFVILFVGLWLIYGQDVLIWTCEEEENAASCYLAGVEFEQQQSWSMARKYHAQACQLGYENGCKRRELIKDKR